MNNDNRKAGVVGKDETKEILMNIMKDSVSLHIMMLLIVYRELSLSQLTDAVKKSKPTVHRRLQAMIECGLVKETREEHVRGNILAKYYRIDETVISKVPNFTKEQIDAMDTTQKLVFFENIRDAIKSTIVFSINTLNEFLGYLNGLDPQSELIPYFNQVDFSMNMSVLTANQFKRWLELYQEFVLKFLQMINETKTSEAGVEKTHLYITAMLPIRRIFGWLEKG